MENKPSIEGMKLEVSEGEEKKSSEQGEQGELYRWVKASEDWERNLSGEMVRDKFNKWPIPYRSVTKSESFGNKFLRFWLSEFDIHTYQAENVEWLCKLSSPPPEGQDDDPKPIFNQENYPTEADGFQFMKDLDEWNKRHDLWDKAQKEVNSVRYVFTNEAKRELQSKYLLIKK